MPTLIELLEAGAHFGHKKERSHPKAKEFTFTLREGVYVIDLEKTLSGLEAALEFLKKQASLGKTILFVGTKKQAQVLTQKVAENTGMPYISHRWLGGTLTNFETIRRNITQLDTLEAKTNSPEFDLLTKKEKKVITDKIEKLMSTFGGVRKMRNLPDAIFVIDAAKEKLALEEGNRMEIPIAAICDTDANPEMVTYPIPANDDAPKTLDMLMKLVETAVLEGEGMKNVEAPKAEVKTETPAKKEEAKEDKKPAKPSVKAEKK
ncbi:TPA: 30S ribosomal protein S2 [Candidatus Berkelbacteria bacterium]|uniref:Small ribosomal subunit protein uS2 n=1 Tax=Berkelbacteria bacterium GW2011_GWE1_39_12 TaxID=1618337 RepID=A0A0G4B348_9BACT|nr:MAG: 30S ribosomal protein S2, small subunit ribosomal protein S2 [Berkelbacteria bacterium GW2011_GWE1_39_12]HBO60602.1 30S ribosomal protein S2 [Candidatus Berkelbacteria bacterium]